MGNLEDDFDFGGKPQRTPSEQAYYYRSLGLQIWPHHLKQPIGMWGEFKNNLTPQAMFDGWYNPVNGKYAGSPDMGVICGAASGGLVVVDLDLYKDKDTNVAANWWDGIKRLHNFDQEFETWEAATGGGGRHIFFRLPPGVTLGNIHSSINVDVKSQGGYIVLPPSSHPKGQYNWVRAPEDYELMTLTPELLEEIAYLNHSYGTAPGGKAERTAPPEHEKTPFDSDIEGREWKLTRRTYHAVHELFRQLGDVPCPPESRWEELFRPAWLRYLSDTKTRIPDVPNEEGLEREGRGYTAFMKKIRYLMRKWGSAQMKVAAARPNPNVGADDGGFEETPKVDPETGEQLPLLQSSAQFLKGFVPPNYLVDGIIQQHYLYALTARTGHGKTAIAMLLGQAVARGKMFHGKQCKQGNVLFLAGENPQDIRARFLMLAHYENFDPYNVPFYFVDGVIDIAVKMPVIRAEAEKIGSLALIIVDTSAAYFRGDDANSNTQQGQFAQLLRVLISLPGNPAVLVNCHPTKAATRDNLVPLGGVHFLNEIDGNLQLWSDDRVGSLEPHAAKWRGAPFEAIDFEFAARFCPAVRDAEGREMSSVIAVPISGAAAEARAAGLEGDENALMRSMHHYPNASIAELAKQTGFLLADGKPHKSKVARLLEALLKDKLVSKFRNGRYRLTKKGAKAIGVKLAGDDDD